MQNYISTKSGRTNLQPRHTSVEAARGGGVTLALYRAIMCALSPFAPMLLRRRALRGKEDTARLGERFGYAARPRPEGTLIWIHGASVGESLSVLPLTSALLEKPDRHVLVTTGTVTSARLMAERLPTRAFHHYVPIDSGAAVDRFLGHWQPDIALLIESEFWPNLIVQTRKRRIPMMLINARLSEKSFRGWSRARGLARRLLSAFDVCIAQDADIAKRLTALGAGYVQISGSLKADAPPLPVDEDALANFRMAVGTRPLFLAASTHPGEEDILLDAASLMQPSHPDMLTVIVPRHPQRGGDIATLCESRGFSAARRSAVTLPAPDTQIYIADTLGELGLFYRAAPFSFLGGSLVPHGGQNPLEPTRLGTAILTGPYTENFGKFFHVLLDAQGYGLIHSAVELASLVLKLFEEPAMMVQMGARAKAASDNIGGATATTVAIAETLLAHHARS